MTRDVLYAVTNALQRARVLIFPSAATIAAQVTLREVRRILECELESYDKNHPYTRGLRYARDLFDPDLAPLTPRTKKKVDTND